MKSRIEDREKASSINSNGVTSPNSNSNGSVIQNPTPPVTPRSISRSESTNPYPTTFVQADTCSFKQVVQMLTGSSKQASDPSSSKASIPAIKTAPKKPTFKLYERRNSLKNGFKISPLIPQQSRSFKSDVLSPSILDFPSLVLSPLTPLNIVSEEDKAIAEKKFYLHPSPRRTPRDSEPQLLPLFPLTSPTTTSSS